MLYPTDPLVPLNMTHHFVIRWLAAMTAAACFVPALAQERIYRCGNRNSNELDPRRERRSKSRDDRHRPENIRLLQDCPVAG